MTIKELSKLAIIQVGNNKCEDVGIPAHVYGYPENITEFELVNELCHLQEFYDEFIIQLPLPPHIRQEVAAAAIDIAKNMKFNKEGQYALLDGKGG